MQEEEKQTKAQLCFCRSVVRSIFCEQKDVSDQIDQITRVTKGLPAVI